MPKKKVDPQEKFVAELRLSSPLGIEVVRSFDVAWHRLMCLPLPARSEFIQFVRVAINV